MNEIARRPSHSRSDVGGQVIPLFALAIVALLAMAALAVDVSGAYALQRFERSAADASALAGAQDLNTPGSRSITGGMRNTARGDALQSLVSLLGASGTGSCNSNADIADCALPGTSYRVSVKTPSPSTGDDHSVQVTVRQPAYQTTFAHVLGISNWNVASTSVAGLGFAAKYALVTLQPPKPRNNGTDANIDKDMIVNGNNSVLNILEGDVGTNTSATTTNSGLIQLATGFYIDHFDDLSAVGDTWTKPDGVHPVGRQISSLIQDPNYVYASFASATTYATQAAGATPCTGANYPTDWLTLLSGTVTCYLPGVYTDNQGFKVNTGEVAYLMPGAYSFPSGATIRGTLTGGLISNQQGVVISLPESGTVTFGAQNAQNVVLNFGSETCSSDSCRAAPAVDASGTQIKTPQGLTITMEVARDGNCFVGTTPTNPASCNVNSNRSINLAGAGKLLIGGILYGPSDNMSINGGSAQRGVVGQIISWSVTYTGGSTLDQSYPGSLGNGVLRLESACSGPGTTCVP